MDLFNEIVQWINQNEHLAKFILTLATIGATAILLMINYSANKIARKSVQEMRKTREEERRPYVSFDIRFQTNSLRGGFNYTGHQMHFVLKNEGLSPAFKVQLRFDQQVKVWNALINKDKEYTLEDLAIVHPIEMLAPGEDFVEWVDNSFDFFQKNETRKFTGTLSYEDERGQSYKIPMDIDLDPFAKRRFTVPKDIPDIVAALQRINRSLER